MCSPGHLVRSEALAQDSLKCLRENLRSQRRDLSVAVQADHARAIVNNLRFCPALQIAKTVAGYLSQDGEPDLTDMLKELSTAGTRVVVPRIANKHMSFIETDLGCQLVRNKWGIKEPLEGQVIQQVNIDVALIPLVGFTDEGLRIGRGGGFYDRYFSERGRTWLIGVAHELQRVDNLNHQSWDVCLDAVVTETGWTLCSDNAKLNWESTVEGRKWRHARS